MTATSRAQLKIDCPNIRLACVVVLGIPLVPQTGQRGNSGGNHVSVAVIVKVEWAAGNHDHGGLRIATRVAAA